MREGLFNRLVFGRFGQSGSAGLFLASGQANWVWEMPPPDLPITPRVPVPLQVLLVEDSEADAELLVHELRCGGYEPAWKRVDTAVALKAALERQGWDVITCDWVMPGFSALAALKLIQEHGVDVPVIIVSGEVGEEVAVTVMKSGAQDYVSKHKLTRLCSAIARELREAEERRARKQAEEALRRREAYFRALIENASDIITVLHPDGTVRYHSPSAQRILGYQPDELEGVNDFDLVHPDDRPALFELFRRGIETPGMRVSAMYRYRHKDGSWRTFEGVGTNLIDDPVVAGIVVNSHDITQRVEMEETLRNSEEYLKALFEYAPDAYYLNDRNGYFVDGNRASEELTGYKREELIGRSFLTAGLIAPEDLPTVAALLPTSVSEPTGPFELVLIRKDQQRVTVEIRTFFVNIKGRTLVMGIARDISERKRTEEALRASGQKYRNLVETAHDVIWSVDMAGRCTFVNQAVRELLGYEPEAILGRPFLDFMSATHSEKSLDLFARTQAGEGHFGYEIELRRKDGVPVIVNSNTIVLRDEHGNAAGATGTLLDITDRKRMEDALRRSEEQFRSIIENTSDLLILVSIDGTIRYASPSHQRVLAYHPDELIGRNFIAFVHPDDAPTVVAALQKHAADPGALGPLQVRVRHHEGSWRHIEVVANPVANDPTVGVINARDITERKRAEEALRASEERLRLAQEAAHLITWDRDLVTGKIVWSSSVTETLGLPSGAFDGTEEGFFALVHPEDRGLARQSVARAVMEGAEYDLEFRLVMPDGNVHWVASRGHVTCDESGKPVRLLGIARDISQRKRVEEEIRRLNMELERRVEERTAQLETMNTELEAFTYCVSHDLRTPLRHLNGFTDLLLQHTATSPDETTAHYAHRITDASIKMGLLIDDLLTLSRTGRAQLLTRRVELSHLIAEVQRELAPAMENRRIAWIIGPLPAVEADPALLRQVVINLLSNAIKYTRPRPETRIEIGATDGANGETVLFVRDNGVGFDPQHAAKLFGAFQRLHSDREFEGTGIGLAIVRRIVERHGGRVWAETKLNHGATFYFTLRPAATISTLPPINGADAIGAAPKDAD
jgi:PAS domain S-box-containing protein